MFFGQFSKGNRNSSTTRKYGGARFDAAEKTNTKQDLQKVIQNPDKAITAFLLALSLLAGVCFNTPLIAVSLDNGASPYSENNSQTEEQEITVNNNESKPAEEDAGNDGASLGSAAKAPTLDKPGTREDIVVITGDSTTPTTPDKPKDTVSSEPETDFDENFPYAPKISFGTGSGLYARWGNSELANEYYLLPDDTVTITASNEPEGSKIYFTGSNSAIDAYKADPEFDFSAENSGWTEYVDGVNIQFNDNYARVGAVMTNANDRAIKGTFISTNFWELNCERKIGIYGTAGNYNLRMTDYLNLSGATSTNISQTYYINFAVNGDVETPSADNYSFALSDSEPAYLNEYLDNLTGEVSLNYSGICVYSKYGEAVYTSDALAGITALKLTPSIVFTNYYDGSNILYYPCTLNYRIVYGGNFDKVYYGVGKIGDTKSLDGWNEAQWNIEINGDIDAADVALYAVLWDSANNTGYTKEDGALVIFEKPLIRVGDTAISGDGDSTDTAISAIALESVGVPEGYDSEIYYTLDGSDPDWYGTLYKGPISIANYAKGDVVTVKAQTRLTSNNNTVEGAVSEKNITVTETAPIFSSENGSVTLANDGGAIYYTTDGSDPKSSATRVEYSAPIDTNGLNRLISAVTYNNGKYSAVSKKVAKSGDYKIGTPDLPYSSNGNLTEFYVSNITDNSGNYIDVTQDITFTLKEPGIVSFDMIYDNIEEDGYSGYRIYHPQIKNSDNSISYTFDYNNTDDGFGHYYIDKKALPAGDYTITVAADNDCIFNVKIKNIAIDREDKVLFSGYRSAIGDTYFSDSGYSLGVDTVKENAVIYYNFTTDGSTPADPTLDSASANPGSSIIYVGSEKPRVKVKAAVYDPKTGELGNTYYGYFVYVGNFDIYATDGEGNRTQVGYDSNVGTYDVIYDKTGKLYISMSDFKEFFPNSDISVQYYFTLGRYESVFNRYDNNKLNINAREYTPGQKITLEDIGVYFDTDYRKTWDFDVKAGAIVTVDGTAYCFNSENYTNICSMPALPNVKVNGSVITLSTESEGAKLYYSFNYNTSIWSPAYNMTEYTGPIDFDRNIAFTAVAVWESAATSWACYDGISYKEKAQFIECETVESFSVPVLTASNQYSDEYYIPITAGGLSQSVDITVPAGIKYQFNYLRTINENGFNSECEALIKLQKKVDGVYVTADDCWYNIPYNEGIWYSDGPFITSGEWRLTFSAVSNSAVGKKAIIYLCLRAENNEEDFTYPRLSGIKVTPKMDGMYIDVNDIVIPDGTVDELYTYITVNKGKAIADIAGEGATEQQAKAVIKAYLEDNSNYDYVRVWRRARNSSGFSLVRDINAGDNWQWTDSSGNLEANTEYVYMAEIYPKHKWNTWTYNVFDRHDNYGWFRTEISDPLYILPEDNENPVITSFKFLQVGDLEVERISKACTIFATATDNQRVRTYRLEYKLSSDSDEKYRNIENGNSATKELSYYKTLKYVELIPGREYTFRFTVTDANGNSHVEFFTAVAEDIPAPQDFTVTKDSSSIIITWTPKKGYSFSYDIYDTNGRSIKSGAWYDYDSTSSENGYLRYYIDPTKYPTFTVKQNQRGYGNYSIDLDCVYKYEQSVGADDEAPIITDIRPYDGSHGGYANRHTNVWAKDDGHLYSIEIGYFTRSGEEGSYVYTLASGFPEPTVCYYPTYDVPFNGGMWYRFHYDCRNAAPGKYYVGVRVTDTAGNTSEWKYSGEFTVTANEIKRDPMPQLNVTAGSDRFYIEPYQPYFDEYTRQNIIDIYIPYYKSVGLTEDMINEFLDNILDYAKVEYHYIRIDGNYDVNITDKIENGEFTYQFTNGDKLPVSGNMSFDWYYPIPDRYYCFYVNLVKDASKDMEAWQSDIFDGSDEIWVTSLPTNPIKLLDDAGAPEISDIINTSGRANVDNSSVVSVNVTDDQLIKEVVIEYRVNGGSWLIANSDTFWHNGGYSMTDFESDRVSSVTASIKISWTRYNDKGDYNNEYRFSDLQNGDTVEIRAYAVDWHGNKSSVKTATYTYIKIDPPTGLAVMPGNAEAKVSWDKVNLPEGILEGTPEYGYRVYTYKTDGDSLFSEIDVSAGVTTAVIPLDTVRYTGSYYFKVSVLTATGGLGDKSEKSADITPDKDITPPTGIFTEETTLLAGTNTEGKINFQINAKDNNFIKTVLVTVIDSNGDSYAKWLYDTVNGDNYFWGYYSNYYYGNIGAVFGESGSINTLDLGALADIAAFTDQNGKRYIPDGVYKLTLTVTDFSDLTYYFETAITVDNSAPDISGGSIGTKVSVKISNSSYRYEYLAADINWSIPEDTEALASLELRLFEFSELAEAQKLVADPKNYVNKYYSSVISTDPNARSIENQLSSGRYYVYLLSATDIAGNRSDYLASDIIYAAEKNYDISVKVNGSAEFTGVMLGDKLTITVTSTIAKQGVVLRLYRVVDNYRYWFADGVFDANGTAAVEITVPATNSDWMGTQYIYAEYYGNANFGSNIKELEIALKLLTPEYIVSTSEIGKISIRWGNVPNSEKYRIYRSTSIDDIINESNFVAETTARSYNDISATFGVRYYYAVVAVASFAGEEVTSVAAVTDTAVSIIKDNSAPSINSVTPNEKNHISNKQTFSISAYDNVKVSSIVVEWKSYDDINAEFSDKLLTYDRAFNENGITVDFSRVHAGASQNIFVRFRVFDIAGNKSEWITNAYAFGDTLSAPSTLKAEPGERKIALGWQSVLRLDVTGYRIYRALNDGDYEILADVSSSVSVYVDDELDPKIAYRYKVCALAGENEGSFTSEVTARPGEQSTPPTVIYLDPLRSSSFNGNLTVTAVASDRIGINRFEFQYAYLGTNATVEPDDNSVWHSAAVITEGIERDNDVDDTMLAGIGHSAFKASAVIDFSTLSGLEEGAWFAVRVRAENNGGAQYASAWYYAKYKYDSLPPSAPSDLKAADSMSGGCITLSFKVPATDVYYTSILRSTDPNADPLTLERVGETASGSFSDTGLTDGTRYYYWFRSVDRAGNISAPVGPVSAVPTSVFSLEFKSVMTDVAVPAAGKPMKITVNFTNNGPAKAEGTLTLTVNFGSDTLTVGSKSFYGLAPGNHNYTFDFTVPDNATSLVFTAEACAKDIVTGEYSVNHAPCPVITAKPQVDSSSTEDYSAENQPI